MSLLAFGGEMGFCVPSDANAVEYTTSGLFDSAFARCCTRAGGSSAYFLTPEVTAQTDFWFHCDVAQQSPFNSDGTLRTLIELLTSNGDARIRLVTTFLLAGDSTWQIEYWNGLAWTSAGSYTADAGSLQTLDIHVVCNSASGSITAYMSGTQRLGSGTIDLSGIADLAQAKCYGKVQQVSTSEYFSQIILANESTIGMKVGTIVLTGQGATHTFDTGGFANVDETVYSDADLWSSATANQVELCTGTPVPSFTGYIVRAVGIWARAKKSGSGPAQMQLALRSAGTTYFSATKALDFGYGQIGNVWETNPATGVAFLGSAIASLEYGVKSIT